MSQQLSTIFLYDITKIDCGLFDPATGISGQSWIVDLAVSGVPDENGFIHDFSDLKKIVRKTLKSTVDHALILPILSKTVEYQDSPEGETWRLLSQESRNSQPLVWQYTCPKGGVFPIRALYLDKESITHEITKSLRHRLPSHIREMRVTLREEDLDPTEAYFRYTHGIPSHEGQCQQLFHGHKSRIEIYLNDKRRPDLEHFVASDILGHSVHITNSQQIVSDPIEAGVRPEPGESPVNIKYKSSCGTFSAQIPRHKVFAVEGETSIESITRQIAIVLRTKLEPQSNLRVRCFEGIDKGAEYQVSVP